MIYYIYIMPNSYEYPPLEGKSPPQLKDYGLSYI